MDAIYYIAQMTEKLPQHDNPYLLIWKVAVEAILTDPTAVYVDTAYCQTTAVGVQYWLQVYTPEIIHSKGQIDPKTAFTTMFTIH